MSTTAAGSTGCPFFVLRDVTDFAVRNVPGVPDMRQAKVAKATY